jgi:hypothetical protein
MDEVVEHVIVESDESQTVAATAAVALAEATAAAAELDAAERLRRFETENEAWRSEHTDRLRTVSDSLTLLREEELRRHAAERAALAENCRQLNERQEAIEAAMERFQSSIPQQSAEEGSEAETTEAIGNPPDMGTAAAITAGPISLDASLAADGETSSEAGPSAHPVRKRRWI